MSVLQIKPDKLLPGDIIHVRGTSLFARMIRRALRKAWGNHDALVCVLGDRTYIGDAAPVICRLTTVDQYNHMLETKACEIMVYRVPNVCLPDRGLVSWWWVENVQGRPYDVMAFPRLLAKCIVGDLWKKAAGWKWANWCTESVANAWGGYATFPQNPTPLHTERMVASGALVDVTAETTEEVDEDTGDIILRPATV